LKRLILLALLLVAASVSLTASQGAFARSSGYDFIVDDNYGTKSACKGANEPTLAAALAVAADENRIYVCPGTYAGGITIDKSVFISAAEHRPLKCYYPHGWTATDPKSYAVFNGGFVIDHDLVTIQNLTIQGAAVGIDILPGRDYFTMYGNIVQNNTVGVHLMGFGQTIDKNCIRQNNLAGTGVGNGILVDAGLTSSQIVNNKSFNNATAGINLIGPAGGGTGAITDLNIGDDQSQDDFHFVKLVDTTNIDINGGKAGGWVPDGDGAEFFVGQKNVDLDIRGLYFKKPDASAVEFDAGGGTLNTGVLVADNTVYKGGTNGVIAQANSLTNSEIRNNKVTRGGGYGIGLLAGNTGNDVTNNYLKQNATDCFDATVGPLNTWSGNLGNTQNQAGLCN
jgi:Periplasmic copper-binding protein (NosD)/Right handed beta helix region